MVPIALDDTFHNMKYAKAAALENQMAMFTMDFCKNMDRQATWASVPFCHSKGFSVRAHRSDGSIPHMSVNHFTKKNTFLQASFLSFVD